MKNSKLLQRDPFWVRTLQTHAACSCHLEHQPFLSSLPFFYLHLAMLEMNACLSFLLKSCLWYVFPNTNILHQFSLTTGWGKRCTLFITQAAFHPFIRVRLFKTLLAVPWLNIKQFTGRYSVLNTICLISFMPLPGGHRLVILVTETFMLPETVKVGKMDLLWSS